MSTAHCADPAGTTPRAHTLPTEPFGGSPHLELHRARLGDQAGLTVIASMPGGPA